MSNTKFIKIYALYDKGYTNTNNQKISGSLFKQILLTYDNSIIYGMVDTIDSVKISAVALSEYDFSIFNLEIAKSNVLSNNKLFKKIIDNYLYSSKTKDNEETLNSSNYLHSIFFKSFLYEDIKEIENIDAINLYDINDRNDLKKFKDLIHNLTTYKSKNNITNDKDNNQSTEQDDVLCSNLDNESFGHDKGKEGLNDKYGLSDDVLKYCTILNNNVYNTNPAVGRNEELKEVMISLFAKSVILVGEPGVGKTAIAESLVYQIKNDNVPDYLKNKIVLGLSAQTLVNGAKFVGMLEERFELIFKELSQRDDIIIFIDEIHTMIGAGASSKDNLSLSNMIKPYLDRKQLTIIGATTSDEYDEIIKTDGAFKRRFERINIKEPNKETLYCIAESAINALIIKTKISFESFDKIINILIEGTSLNSRVYDDIVYNPDLILTIIEKIFAIAAYNCRNYIIMDDVIDSIKTCDRIYSYSKEKMINDLKKLNTSKKRNEVKKIISFPKI